MKISILSFFGYLFLSYIYAETIMPLFCQKKFRDIDEQALMVIDIQSSQNIGQNLAYLNQTKNDNEFGSSYHG